MAPDSVTAPFWKGEAMTKQIPDPEEANNEDIRPATVDPMTRQLNPAGRQIRPDP